MIIASTCINPLTKASPQIAKARPVPPWCHPLRQSLARAKVASRPRSRYICIYVYMYICIYVYMYICIYVYKYICINVYMYICIYVNVYVCMYVCTYQCCLVQRSVNQCNCSRHAEQYTWCSVVQCNLVVISIVGAVVVAVVVVIKCNIMFVVGWSGVQCSIV